MGGMGRTVIVWPAAGSLLAAVAVLVAVRGWIRSRREYMRLLLVPYRTDRAGAEATVAMFEALHAAIAQRWWRRLLGGQASVALEVHRLPGRGTHAVALAVTCPAALRARVEAALRTAYPNLSCERFPVAVGRPPDLLRLKKRGLFVTRVAVADPRRVADPPVDRVIGAMDATSMPCMVQVALTPVPALFELYSRWLYRGRERQASDARERGER